MARRQEGFQQAANNINRILTNLGKQEQSRQNRQALDRVANAVASGANTIEAIRAAADQPAEFESGIGGLGQRFGNILRPQEGRGGISEQLDELLLKSRLGDIFGGSTLTPGEKGKAERIKAGLLPRASTTSATRPTAQTPEERDFARDTKLLQNKKVGDNQKERARGRLRKSTLLKDVTPNSLDFEGAIKGKTRVLVDTAGINDKAFGEKAYVNALKEAKELALSQGLAETSVEAEFNKWWDSKVAAEKGESFIEFVPRSEFQEVSKAGLVPDLATAPDPKLAEFWKDLPDEEKVEINDRLKENPKNIDAILRILNRG